jgi:hypothetical protein
MPQSHWRKQSNLSAKTPRWMMSCSRRQCPHEPRDARVVAESARNTRHDPAARERVGGRAHQVPRRQAGGGLALCEPGRPRADRLLALTGEGQDVGERPLREVAPVGARRGMGGRSPCPRRRSGHRGGARPGPRRSPCASGRRCGSGARLVPSSRRITAWRFSCQIPRSAWRLWATSCRNVAFQGRSRSQGIAQSGKGWAPRAGG